MTFVSGLMRGMEERHAMPEERPGRSGVGRKGTRREKKKKEKKKEGLK